MPPTSLPGPTDAELARRIPAGGAGAQRAFAELQYRHERRLRAYLRTAFPRHADDIAQETWMRAFRWLSKPRTVTNFRGWLFEVAENYGIDLCRRKEAVPFADGEEPVAEEIDAPLDGLIDLERVGVVRACLKELGEEFRVVLMEWAGGSGRSPEELAATVGVAVGTVYTRKKRALEALAKCVKKKLK